MENLKKTKPKKANKPRRANKAQKTQSYQPRKSKLITQDQLTKALDAEHRRIDFSEPGARFAEMMLNPFGSHAAGPMHTGAVVPDGSSNRMGMTVVSHGTFSGGTATSGVIQMIEPTNLGNGVGIVCYGNDATDSTASPTANAMCSSPQGTIAAAMHPTGTMFRKVSAGIRVMAISAPDDTSGLLRGYQSSLHLRTGAATYSTYANIINYPIEESHTLHGPESGITIRATYTRQADEWAATPATSYANGGAYFTGVWPAVGFSGLGASTTLAIETVLHYEIQVAPSIIPIPLQRPAFERELGALIAFCNSQEMVVSSETFRSFLNSVKKGFKHVMRYIAAHPQLVTDAISFLAA